MGTWHIGQVHADTACGFNGWMTIAFGASSTVSAHTRATIQPISVQPSSRFRAKIAPELRLRKPIIVGKKYNANAKTIGIIKKCIVSEHLSSNPLRFVNKRLPV